MLPYAHKARAKDREMPPAVCWSQSSDAQHYE